MILTFQKIYRYSPDGLHLASYQPGDTIDIDPEGAMKEFIPGILEGEFAIETKPDTYIETPSSAETEIIENTSRRKKR
jgi:hypothetical protein